MTLCLCCDRFHSTQLHEELQAQGVRRLLVAGVATEYCVYWSVRDAVELGYEVGSTMHGPCSMGITLLCDAGSACQVLHKLGLPDICAPPSDQVPRKAQHLGSNLACWRCQYSTNGTAMVKCLARLTRG